MCEETMTRKGDVIFCIDATGSMASSILAAYEKVNEIAKQLKEESPEVDYMFGAVCYRDPIDKPGNDVHEFFNLSHENEELTRFLGKIKAKGGGDGPEDYVGAYNIILSCMEWREGSARSIIHIADAPAHTHKFCGYENHEEEEGKLEKLIEEIALMEIDLHCISINGQADISFEAMKEIYKKADKENYFSSEELNLPNSQQRQPDFRGCRPKHDSDSSKIGEQLITSTVTTCLRSVSHRFHS